MKRKDMMKRRPFTLVIGLITAFVLAACQGETDATDTSEVTAATTADTATTGTETSAAVPYDLQFIDSMSKHHEGAVMMAAAAAEKATNTDIRKAAAKMVEDSRKEIAELKAWRDQWYPGAAGAENMDMPGMSSMGMDMSHMQTMNPGPDFDTMFLDMMIPHHQGAIEMSRDALTKAERQEIRDFAQKVIDTQTKEIEQMNAWKTEAKK